MTETFKTMLFEFNVVFTPASDGWGSFVRGCMCDCRLHEKLLGLTRPVNDAERLTIVR